MRLPVAVAGIITTLLALQQQQQYHHALAAKNGMEDQMELGIDTGSVKADAIAKNQISRAEQNSDASSSSNSSLPNECIPIDTTTACAPWNKHFYINSTALNTVYGLPQGTIRNAEDWDAIMVSTTAGLQPSLSNKNSREDESSLNPTRMLWADYLGCTGYNGAPVQLHRSYACLTDIMYFSSGCNAVAKTDLPGPELCDSTCDAYAKAVENMVTDSSVCPATTNKEIMDRRKDIVGGGQSCKDIVSQWQEAIGSKSADTCRSAVTDDINSCGFGGNEQAAQDYCSKNSKQACCSDFENAIAANYKFRTSADLDLSFINRAMIAEATNQVSILDKVASADSAKASLSKDLPVVDFFRNKAAAEISKSLVSGDSGIPVVDFFHNKASDAKEINSKQQEDTGSSKIPVVDFFHNQAAKQDTLKDTAAATTEDTVDIPVISFINAMKPVNRFANNAQKRPDSVAAVLNAYAANFHLADLFSNKANIFPPTLTNKKSNKLSSEQKDDVGSAIQSGASAVGSTLQTQEANVQNSVTTAYNNHPALVISLVIAILVLIILVITGAVILVKRHRQRNRSRVSLTNGVLYTGGVGGMRSMRPSLGDRPSIGAQGIMHSSASYSTDDRKLLAGNGMPTPAKPERYKVTFGYTPSLPDEVELRVGDILEVAETFDDGWGRGRNLDTGASGIFPMQCCTKA